MVSTSSSPVAASGRGKIRQMLQSTSVGSDQTAHFSAEKTPTTSQEKKSQDKSSDDARRGAPATSGDTGQTTAGK